MNEIKDLGNGTYIITEYPSNMSAITFSGLSSNFCGSEKKAIKALNLYVPEHVYVNEELKEVTVKWKDITIKVICDTDDTFSVDAAYAQALKYKIFGSKTQYKKKWWNIISKKITWLGNLHISETLEKIRRQQIKEEIEEKKKKKADKEYLKEREDAKRRYGLISILEAKNDKRLF